MRKSHHGISPEELKLMVDSMIQAAATIEREFGTVQLVERVRRSPEIFILPSQEAVHSQVLRVSTGILEYTRGRVFLVRDGCHRYLSMIEDQGNWCGIAHSLGDQYQEGSQTLFYSRYHGDENTLLKLGDETVWTQMGVVEVKKAVPDKFLELPFKATLMALKGQSRFMNVGSITSAQLTFEISAAN